MPSTTSPTPTVHSTKPPLPPSLSPRLVPASNPGSPFYPTSTTSPHARTEQSETLTNTPSSPLAKTPLIGQHTHTYITNPYKSPKTRRKIRGLESLSISTNFLISDVHVYLRAVYLPNPFVFPRIRLRSEEGRGQGRGRLSGQT